MAAKGTPPKAKASPSGNTEPISLPRSAIAGKARVTDPGFRRDKGVTLADREQSFLGSSIRELRSVPAAQAIRALTRFNGIFSAAVHCYVQMAMSGYVVTGYLAGTREFDLATSIEAVNVLTSADTLYDYTRGYADKQSTDGLLESLLKETVQSGACCVELVLNKFLLPEKVLSVSVPSLRWKSTTEGTVYPSQVSLSGEEIDLNMPTVFYAATHQQSGQFMPRSPMEAALQTLFIFTEFLEDLSRVMRRSGHSRLVVSIVQDAVKQMAPPETANDPEKMRQFFESVRGDIESTLGGLEPEDALVAYDTVTAEILSSKGEKTDYSALLETLGNMMSSSLKSVSSVLGLGTGSQNLATTESLVYLKLVQGIQKTVETVMSRAITLSVRLRTGVDSYCKFEFQPVNLRPEDELSAHKSVIFQQELQKLSLGLYSDEEFAWRTTGSAAAPGMPKLSGTMFMQPTQALPKDQQLNTDGQQRNLNEGTSKGSPVSQPGGKPLPSQKAG